MFEFDQDSAQKLIQLVLEHLIDWPIKSAERFRNAALGGMFAINPLFDIRENKDISFLQDLIRDTILEGRMIDFGFIPNAVIQAESLRSRPLFEADEFVHPYDTWLGVTSWEGGYNGYLVTPHPNKGSLARGDDKPNDILVIELYGVSIPGAADVVLLYDMVSIRVEGIGKSTVSPATMTIPPGYHPHPDGPMSLLDLEARGANSLDPLVTMLRILADASVPVTHFEAPERLNRARAKKGKGPIPSHMVVHTSDYVADYRTAAARKPGQGGHHASPIAHWRRAHVRHLGDGRIIPVRSSKVNWRSNEELHRLFYHIGK